MAFALIFNISFKSGLFHNVYLVHTAHRLQCASLIYFYIWFCFKSCFDEYCIVNLSKCTWHCVLHLKKSKIKIYRLLSLTAKYPPHDKFCFSNPPKTLRVLKTRRKRVRGFKKGISSSDRPQCPDRSWCTSMASSLVAARTGSGARSAMTSRYQPAGRLARHSLPATRAAARVRVRAPRLNLSENLACPDGQRLSCGGLRPVTRPPPLVPPFL